MKHLKTSKSTLSHFTLIAETGVLFIFGVFLLVGTSLRAATQSNRFEIVRGAPYYLDAGTGILVGSGEALPGLDLRFNGRLNTEPVLYLGGELGMFFYSHNVNSGAVIPILGSISTLFEATPRIHPTLGLSLGPAISTGDGYSSARFALLLDPGARFDIGDSIALTALTRFGVIGSTFVALPQVSISIAL